MLGEDEAIALAAVLEELAAHHRADPLGARALQAAALLRQRVAARAGHGARSWPAGPAGRRESGDTRDDAADRRDADAEQRDLRASERDDQARERGRQADDADQEARARELRLRDLLWDAELRDQAAAEHAAGPAPAGAEAMHQQWQLDREMAETDRDLNREDRENFREFLLQGRAARQAAALRGRYADERDRLAGQQDRRAAEADRQHAARDRHASRADRDQAVIESEEQNPPSG